MSASFTALLQRRMEFRRIFVARFCNALVAAVVTLLMVGQGFSYQALVGGVLGGSFAQLLVLVVTSRWRPTRSYDRVIAGELWRFSRWAMLTGLLAWFFVFADSLIVGAWLDTRSLGIYNTTSSLMALTLGLCVAPILPVLYSSLVKMRSAPDSLRHSLIRASRVIAFMVAPVCAIAIALSGPLATILFGPSWHGVEHLLVPMALAAAFSWIAVANNEAYRARGQPELETRIMLICAVVYLAGYLVAIRFGLIPYAWTRCALAAFGFLVHLRFAGRYLGIRWTDTLVRLATPFAAGALTAASGWAMVRLGVLEPGGRVGLAAAGGALALVYLAFVLLVARDFVREEVPAILFPRGTGRT
jgi:O-antigen/teichoic acid export membrane protein